LVPPFFQASELDLPQTNRRYGHVSESEKNELIRHHRADWFRAPDSKGRGGVLRMKEKFAIRGLSCKIGETLSLWLHNPQHCDVAQVIVAAQFQ
jgi:hypothetical protein